MLNPEKYTKLSQQLIEIGQKLHQSIWATSTSGNYSVKLDEQHIAITASGSVKGALTSEDILIIDMKGRPLFSEKKPSSDTIDHLNIYHQDPKIGAVLHFHSMHATLVTEIENNELTFENYEVLKALQGITSFNSKVSLPIFENNFDHQMITQQIKEYRKKQDLSYGYLVRRHGAYIWGDNLSRAYAHAEAFEFLFMCRIKEKELGVQ